MHPKDEWCNYHSTPSREAVLGSGAAHSSWQYTGQGWLLDSASQELRALPANQVNMGLCAEFPRETLLPYLLCTPYCFPLKLFETGLAWPSAHQARRTVQRLCHRDQHTASLSQFSSQENALKPPFPPLICILKVLQPALRGHLKRSSNGAPEIPFTALILSLITRLEACFPGHHCLTKGR